ncbi:MAG: hypothetical protein RLZZ84_2258 [Pseudomonadota bacterium]|jgi:Zn-dependent protease
MSDTIYQAAALVIPMILAIVFHEIAHGWTARALGDPTAAELNRLSLNPLRHVDPFGTIILPGMLKLIGAPVFGWAKPVPVNALRLRNPRRDMMFVGAAGPAMNLIMALVGAVLLGGLMRPYAAGQEPSVLVGFVAANLLNFLLLNVFLALFNLIPLPPFDGSHIVEGLLPDQAARSYRRLRPMGFPLMLLLLVLLPSLIPGFDIVGRFVFPPVQWLTEQYLALAAAIAGGK